MSHALVVDRLVVARGGRRFAPVSFTARTGEAVIITGTAALLGCAMVTVSFAHLAYATLSAGLGFALDVPLAPFFGALLVTTAITVATTLVPTLGTQRLPEPRIIARFVAE